MMRSMFAGVSGLRNHQVKMDVIGNNIANVNTTGFKAGRVTFQDMLSQTIRGGTAPQAGGAGGINPAQIGLGMIIGAIDTLHTQGNLGTTGKATDMAIQGEGFFVMGDGEALRYSRDGTFDIGPDLTLANPASGYRVQGWQAVDGVVETTAPVGDLTIPIGAELVARATSNINLVGNLDAAGDIATTGTNALSGGLYDVTTGDGALATTLLTNLSSDGTAGGNLGLVANGTITIDLKKNNIGVETVTIAVDAGTTLQDLADEIENAAGIVSAGVGGIDESTLPSFVAQQAEVAVQNDTVTPANATYISLVGNRGSANAITDIFVRGFAADGTELTDVAATISGDPGNGFTETASADGESLMSTMIAYDSLGVSHVMNVFFTKTANNQWSWNADCADQVGNDLNIGSGVINFTQDGVYSSDDGTFSLELGNGAITPLVVDFDLASLTQFSKESTVSVRDQDGFSAGTLEKFSVGADGLITGIYTNGLTDTLGQIAIANFANPGGLLKEGNNLYAQSTNSGTRQIGAAGTGGRGYINNGVLELSNVDLPQSFTDMIITQRGFQANARVITTSDDMLQELVNLKR